MCLTNAKCKGENCVYVLYSCVRLLRWCWCGMTAGFKPKFNTAFNWKFRKHHFITSKLKFIIMLQTIHHFVVSLLNNKTKGFIYYCVYFSLSFSYGFMFAQLLLFKIHFTIHNFTHICSILFFFFLRSSSHCL